MIANKPELDGAAGRTSLVPTDEEGYKEVQVISEIAGTPILGHEMDGRRPVDNRGELESPQPQMFEMPAREPAGTEQYSLPLS
jgi:hypothetical protein